ncbi:alpha/beta hydrolase [Allonocardiopsis opalescens]|uniref:Acetyl esterase/lipase n=1 Tax=Allonocardiopsis opalescens TaxID=1144618 RepID=A0A2T0Q7I4_9ACTN|nr:alpha/beta hydrolase [Allonocardiopsis opalescens]PRX99754.1 acetyl esterase/lipase [Allonocardiopsis opalescens]
MPLPPLDPDAAAIAAAAAELPPMRVRGIAAIRAALEKAPHPQDLAVMAETEDRVITGPHGDIPLRVYRPEPGGPAPVLVYFHGGGMCMGSIHSFEPLARALAAASGAAVVSVGYHLAPESPPPAQFDDAYTATAWVAEHAAELRVDPDRLAVVGDSAGGTLAAAVALAARDRGGPRIVCQVLVYPGLDRDMAARSMTQNADAPILSRDDVRYLNETADAGQGSPDSPYRVPAYAADLGGLPPAVVATAERDPLRDWGERYADRLREAGVQTTLTRYPGSYHGFALQAAYLARGRLAVAETGALLRAKFAHPLPF